MYVYHAVLLAHVQLLSYGVTTVCFTHSLTVRSPPPVLLSEDREQEEWAGPEAQPEGPLHYEGVRGGEVRTHGVGYYAFSSDETKRQEQMKLLDNLKKQVCELCLLCAGFHLFPFLR